MITQEDIDAMGDDVTPMDELLNCPFCGGVAEYTSRPNSDTYGGWSHDVDHWIYCQTEHCHVHMGMCETRDESVKAWNTRAALIDKEPTP